MNYRCKASGCDATPGGSHLAQHYNNKTKWELFTKLQSAVGAAAVEKLRSLADPHTLFIFDKGYSKKRLPTWQTHTMVKEIASSGQQETISKFFQVSSPRCKWYINL